MPFRRFSSMAKRPIHSIKHVVDVQQAIALGVQANQVLIEAVDAPVLANTREVETGSKVNSIYLRVEGYATTSGALANFYIIIFKNPGGNLTVPQPNGVGANDNKNNVIHQEMVMFQKQTGSNPRTLFNGVLMIPKGKRRFGINDLLQIAFFAPGVNVDACFQCIFKEYR